MAYWKVVLSLQGRGEATLVLAIPHAWTYHVVVEMGRETRHFVVVVSLLRDEKHICWTLETCSSSVWFWSQEHVRKISSTVLARVAETTAPHTLPHMHVYACIRSC